METILNIYLIIDDNYVVAFKAKGYERDGDDKSKIQFLKESAREDFKSAYVFEAPKNNKGNFMKYSQFSKLEKQGMQYNLFEEIFEKFNAPSQPIVCVTPVVNGEVWSQY